MRNGQGWGGGRRKRKYLLMITKLMYNISRVRYEEERIYITGKSIEISERSIPKYVYKWYINTWIVIWKLNKHQRRTDEYGKTLNRFDFRVLNTSQRCIVRYERINVDGCNKPKRDEEGEGRWSTVGFMQTGRLEGRDYRKEKLINIYIHEVRINERDDCSLSLPLQRNI